MRSLRPEGLHRAIMSIDDDGEKPDFSDEHNGLGRVNTSLITHLHDTKYHKWEILPTKLQYDFGVGLIAVQGIFGFWYLKRARADQQ